MAVLGQAFINLLANDIKSFSNAGGVSAINVDRRFHYLLDVDQIWHGTMALVAGTLTFSLESLVRVNQPTLDLTGLEATWFLLFNLPSNAAMNIVAAATNGYPITGGTTDGQDVGPGGLVLLHEPAGFGVVGPTLSDITVTGTGTEVLEIWLAGKDLS